MKSAKTDFVQAVSIFGSFWFLCHFFHFNSIFIIQFYSIFIMFYVFFFHHFHYRKSFRSYWCSNAGINSKVVNLCNSLWLDFFSIECHSVNSYTCQPCSWFTYFKLVLTVAEISHWIKKKQKIPIFLRAVENFGNRNTYIKSSLKIKPKLQLEFRFFFYFSEATH